MAKKIRITESQLKKVVSIINEESYDQSIETYKKEKAREVFMSNDDANLMKKLAEGWCEGRVSHPDCVELEQVIKKLKL